MKMSSEAIQLAKGVFRENIKNVLNEIPLKSYAEQSNVVQRKLLESPEWERAKRVSLYLSIKHEIETDGIVEAGFNAGKELFVPFCKKDSMRMFKLFGPKDFKYLPRNSWGIREPKPIRGRDDAMKTGGLDLVIVPGMAFTPKGDRLGHGKGYYDRYLKELEELHKLNGTAMPNTIALSLCEQIVDTLPLNVFDVQIQRVIYDNDSIYDNNKKA